MIPAFIINWKNQKNASVENNLYAEVSTNDVVKKKTKKSPDKVLQTKGELPDQPSPMEEARAREYEQQQAWTREQQRLQQEREAKAVADAAALDKWRRGRTSARDAAISNAGNRLESMGYGRNDPYGIMQMFSQRINTNDAGLQDLDDYSQAYSPAIFDEVTDSIRSRKRADTRKGFEQNIGKYYGDDLFADNADDAYIDEIINSQFGVAETELKNARDRGQLDSLAFDRALSDIVGRKDVARTEANELGGTVLNNNRTALNRMRDDSLEQIGTLDISDIFDNDRETGRIKQRGEALKGSLGADVKRAIGNRKFFDTGSTINAANALLGAQNNNTGVNALYNTMVDQRQKQQEGLF
jgi:hypothetical protein